MDVIVLCHIYWKRFMIHFVLAPIIFMMQLILTQWNFSSHNQVYKRSLNASTRVLQVFTCFNVLGWYWRIPLCCQNLSSMGKIPLIRFHNSRPQYCSSGIYSEIGTCYICWLFYLHIFRNVLHQYFTTPSEIWNETISTCVLKIFLCLCLILSFSRGESYLDGKPILEKECLWVLVEYMRFSSDFEFEYCDHYSSISC